MRSNRNGIFMKNTSKFPLGLNLFPILAALLISCFQIEGQAINGTGKINGDIGVQAFNEILEQKKNNSVNLPAIYGFDRNKNPQQSPKVLYLKGPVKLNELEIELGEQKFMNFLREAANAKVKETDELIKLLARVSNQKMAENFLQKLKE